MNRAQYIISLFEYGSDGESKFRHKVAGAALGLGGLGVAALATHAATKGQSLGASLGDLGHGVSNWGKAHNFSVAPKAGVTTPTGSGATTFQGYGVKTTTTPSGVTTPYGSSTGSPKAPEVPHAPVSAKAPEAPHTPIPRPEAPQAPSHAAQALKPVEAPKAPVGEPASSVSPMAKTPTTSAPPSPMEQTPGVQPATKIQTNVHGRGVQRVPGVQPSPEIQSPGATQASPEPPKVPASGGPGQVRQDTRGLGPTELVKKPETDEVVRGRGQEVYDRIKANMDKMKKLQGGLENVGKETTTPPTGATQLDQHVKDQAHYTRPATGRNWGYQLP